MFVQFEGFDVYYGLRLKKMSAAPSNHCFCLKVSLSTLHYFHLLIFSLYQASIPGAVAPAIPPRDTTKVFCAESEQLMKTWIAGIRVAKVNIHMLL